MIAGSVVMRAPTCSQRTAGRAGANVLRRSRPT